MSRRTTILAATLAVLAVGCSSDDIAERVAEEAAEQAAGGEGEVDIDLDDSGSGNVSVETSEGSMSFGAGGDLPESFPEDLPLPEGDYQVVSSMEQSNADSGMRVQAALMTATPWQEVADRFEQALPDAGWEITNTQETSMDELQSVTFAIERDGEGGVVTITSDTQDETLVNYGIGEGAG